MNMKICDGADWLNGDFERLISHELREVPRFHRKQWEFAAIFQALYRSDILRPDAVGISFGAGRELLLYAIANHVRQLWGTDLYTADTAWPGARTADPKRVTDFVREGSPILTSKERISAKSMDMREIEFPDESFDFAYSSSAVEHIGSWSDFGRHLAEVRRVLKPGGVYVMTTDITFGPTTECPANFKFSTEGLEWWLHNSGMAYEPMVDCRIARNYINTPLPHDIACYITPDSGRIQHNLFGTLLMTQNLAGCHPHTSVMLVMKRGRPDIKPVYFIGYERTQEFLVEARRMLGTILEESTLFPNPSAWIPENLKSELWATTYMWLGGKSRRVNVKVAVDQAGSVSLGVNKAHSDRYWEALVEKPLEVYAIERELAIEFLLPCDEMYSYSVHGAALPGTNLKHVDVTIEDCRLLHPIQNRD